MLEEAVEEFPKNLIAFEGRFGTEDACRAYLMAKRWPEGYRCPRCGHDRGWHIEARHLIQCAACDYQVSLTAGTVLEGTRKPLTVWFKAIWLMVTRKTGISAKDLKRALGFGSYQTAWAWLHKLRRAMVRPGRERLSGRVQVDVTEVTCTDPRRYPDPQTLVQVAVEDRGEFMGRVRMQVVDSQSAPDLIVPLVDDVAEGATVHSDGWSGYNSVPDAGFDHDVDVIGRDRERATVLFPHVHRIASLLKRFLLGTYQGAVRWFQLKHYLEEFTFRFNRRSSRAVGKLFMRLAEQAIRAGHTPYRSLRRGGPQRAVGA
jgi:transposase-like protein